MEVKKKKKYTIERITDTKKVYFAQIFLNIRFIKSIDFKLHSLSKI